MPNEAVCAAAAAELAAARWPVVVVGSEARGCVPELRELADRLVAPLICTDFTDLADLPFPTADPRFLGLYGEDPAVLEGCDLVLAIGARMFYPFSAVRHPRLPPAPGWCTSTRTRPRSAGSCPRRSGSSRRRRRRCARWRRTSTGPSTAP